MPLLSDKVDFLGLFVDAVGALLVVVAFAVKGGEHSDEAGFAESLFQYGHDAQVLQGYRVGDDVQSGARQLDQCQFMPEGR